jgi:hypothetical protein
MFHALTAFTATLELCASELHASAAHVFSAVLLLLL